MYLNSVGPNDRLVVESFYETIRPRQLPFHIMCSYCRAPKTQKNGVGVSLCADVRLEVKIT
jgi:hypothetical protein